MNLVTLPGAARAVVFLTLLAAAGGCTAGRTAGDTGPAGGQPQARPAPPPLAMGGRWLLASPGRGQCNVTLSGTPGSAEGTVAPAGGCPGSFFTSRKWSYDSEGLLISDHNAAPLARLSLAGAGFNGQATAGEPITLSR